jgi:hypothetical protein
LSACGIQLPLIALAVCSLHREQCMETLRLERQRQEAEVADLTVRIQGEWEAKHRSGVEELQRLTTAALEEHEQRHRRGAWRGL